MRVPGVCGAGEARHLPPAGAPPHPRPPQPHPGGEDQPAGGGPPLHRGQAAPRRGALQGEAQGQPGRGQQPSLHHIQVNIRL